jgi:hypothetical protein
MFAQQRLEESEALYRSVAGRLKVKLDDSEDPLAIDHCQIEERIDKAIKMGEEINAARERSYLKKSGKHLVDFAHNLRGLLAGYTEMKAVISGAAPPFSQIVYGGLHILLQVSSNCCCRI